MLWEGIIQKKKVTAPQIFISWKKSLSSLLFLPIPFFSHQRSPMSGEEFAFGPTKLLRVRVFSTPRLCTFFAARWYHTKLIPGIPPFSVKHTDFLAEEIIAILVSKSAGESKAEGEEWAAVTAGAGEPLWGECALSYFFVVCCNFHAAAAASLRACLKFWDIWHISHFPAAVLLIQSLVCLVGSSSFIYSPLVL